ncbi:hypothetical protein Ancab_035709 [Ancistrocladus abbreviatus]
MTEASVSTEAKCQQQRDTAGTAWGSSQSENQNNRAKQIQITHKQQNHSRANATPLETPANRKPEWDDTISAQHHHHSEAGREANNTDFIPDEWERPNTSRGNLSTEMGQSHVSLEEEAQGRLIHKTDNCVQWPISGLAPSKPLLMKKQEIIHTMRSHDDVILKTDSRMEGEKKEEAFSHGKCRKIKNTKLEDIFNLRLSKRKAWAVRKPPKKTAKKEHQETDQANGTEETILEGIIND